MSRKTNLAIHEVATVENPWGQKLESGSLMCVKQQNDGINDDSNDKMKENIEQWYQLKQIDTSSSSN